jgi:hypothetical protein
MTILKEFEEALREQGMDGALAVLEKLKERQRAKRSVTPARRMTERNMTTELAQQVLILHKNLKMSQKEIAFKLGINQGRVNDVIKRGKWLSSDPQSPKAVVRGRDRALERLRSFAHVNEALPAAGELTAALDTLGRSGTLTEVRSRKLSVRIDPGPFDLLAERLGTDNPTEVINAALVLASAPNRFKTWLMTIEDRLPDDFELPV